jgi:predicted nucleic acid-binding protein
MSDLAEPQNRCFIDTNIWLYAFIETDDEQIYAVKICKMVCAYSKD